MFRDILSNFFKLRSREELKTYKNRGQNWKSPYKMTLKTLTIVKNVIFELCFFLSELFGPFGHNFLLL